MNTPTRNNAGRVWQNLDKKKKTSPDYTGKATINGVEYYVSAWHDPATRSANTQGKGSFGLRFTPVADADEGRHQARQKRRRQSESNEAKQRSIDDDIPF